MSYDPSIPDCVTLQSDQTYDPSSPDFETVEAFDPNPPDLIEIVSR